MGHKKNNNNSGTKKKGATQELPMVSICTPTFNRRPFIPMMLECFRHQTYPRSRLEWIIVDDGTDSIKDLIEEATDLKPFIKYYYFPQKMTLGKKRNLMHENTRGSIIVYMDDDDYYPPERVEHAVKTLRANPKAMCAGSSEMYIYFKHLHKMVQFGPYGPNHATAATFAFRKELLLSSAYEDTASLAEEKAFLRDYTVPFVQLDPFKTILVFSHVQNTFDKKKLLENPHPQFVKYSNRSIDDDFKVPEKIKKYFLEDIDAALDAYKPGDPSMKPDVLKQLVDIESSRKKIEEELKMQQSPQQQQQQQQIFIDRGNGERIPLTSEQIVELITGLQNQVKELTQKIQILTANNNKN